MVGAAWDVNCVEGEVRVDNANERVDPLEDLVDGTVATSAIPPTFNHSLVVTVDGKVPSSMVRVVELVYQTSKANSFSPSNVSLSVQGLPSWDEPPGPSLTQDNDSDSEARAHIREHKAVGQGREWIS